MSYYRFALDYPTEDGNEKRLRSLTPLSVSEIQKYRYGSYRYYTSEKDDTPQCHVISLGYDRSYPGKQHGPRSINRFILHYVTHGKGTVNGSAVRAGQVFFTHPYEEFVINSDRDEPLEFYYIGIAGPGTEAIMKNTGFLSVPKIMECPFISRIPTMFYEPLFEASADTDPDYYLMSFFLRLMSLHKNHNIKVSEEPTDDAFFYYKQTLRFIEEYLLRGITPSDVAQFLHISPSYLRVIFSRYCKFSLRELLIRKRIECAANHLVFHQCSVMEAANLCGYEDYTLFSRIFKKYTGMSPRAYKQLHREHITPSSNQPLTVFPDEEAK